MSGEDHVEKYRIEWAVDYQDKIVRSSEIRGLGQPRLNFVSVEDDEKREIVSELNRITKFMEITAKHLHILNELLKTDVVFEIWIGDFILQMYYEPSWASFDFTIYAPGSNGRRTLKLEVGKIVFTSIPSQSCLTHPLYAAHLAEKETLG